MSSDQVSPKKVLITISSSFPKRGIPVVQPFGKREKPRKDCYRSSQKYEEIDCYCGVFAGIKCGKYYWEKTTRFRKK